MNYETTDGEEDQEDNASEFLGLLLPKVCKAARRNKKENRKICEGQKELITISKEKMVVNQIVANNVVMSKDGAGATLLRNTTTQGKQRFRSKWGSNGLVELKEKVELFG
ncbi:hypothetical protein VP01_3387g2 [Puccinia sorghi]|uniref:Uncharacterized protein n=1 Tax=Puccinia sorghi TaxID=27349 RepID=A0A0L6UYM0_9BASI|nr:hypothetical protein VP01_3387g2 [Puccinia sorghi]